MPAHVHDTREDIKIAVNDEAKELLAVNIPIIEMSAIFADAIVIFYTVLTRTPPTINPDETLKLEGYIGQLQSIVDLQALLGELETAVEAGGRPAVAGQWP